MTEPHEPLTPLEGNLSSESMTMTRDSIITYSTDVDVVDSSIIETQTLETVSTSKGRSVAQNNETPFYRRKRFWGICLAVTVVLSAILIPLFFFVIFPAIAQKTIDGSILEITAISITNPTNDSFFLSSSGNISNGGKFHSKLTFKTSLTMFWEDNELGTVNFDPIEVKDGKSEINLQNKEFIITELDNVIDFSKTLMTQESLSLSFKGSVSIKALGITKGGLKLNKKVVVNGVNNFGTPNITSFFISQPDTKTLALNITVLLNNPSVFSMPLGTVGITASYNGTVLSDMIIPDFNLVPGDINLTMYGNATMPKTLEDAYNFGVLMSSYLTNTPVNTTSTVRYSLPDHVNSVGWINSAINGTNITAVMGGQPNGPPQLITGLNFGDVSLNFTTENPFDPIISSTNSIVQYKLPFNISTTTLEASQNITLYSNGTSIASIVTDFFPVKDDQTGDLNLNIPPTKLNVTSKEGFENFLVGLTLLPQLSVNITGHAGIVTMTPIGNLTLNGLPFTLNTTLEGLSGFQTVTPVVKNATLIGGTKDNLIVQVTTSLTNPANVSLSAGSINFQVLSGDGNIGLATTNLTLAPGPNDLVLYTYLDPTHNPVAQELLANFVSNQTTTVTLKGYDGSTDIESLKLAMSSISISAPFPGLTAQMISSASLIIKDTTETSVNAAGVVSLANPFIAPISILNLDSTITSQGYFLGEISQDRSNDPIILPANGNLTVSDLPLSLNLDPPSMFGFLRKQAQLANLDTTVIDALITIGRINVPGVTPVTTIDPKLLENFDINSYVEKALANIVANVTLVSTVQVGDYVMPFKYSQIVTTHTDSSIVKLIPILSKPIVQTLVDASEMNIQSLFIQKPTEESFDTVINGQISNTGPLPATITFTNGAVLVFDNTILGTLSLPPITSQDNQATLKNVQSTFKVQNKDALATFTSNILLTDSASWTITAENLTVTALKLDIPGITMQKTVELKGGNGFKDDIKISNYSLPGDAPNGGITTIIDSTLTNPSTVGIELGTVTFDVLSDNIKIGEVSSSDFTIAPAIPTEIKLTGRLIPQTSEEGLKEMTKIFSQVIAEQPVDVVTKVTGLQPSISWLVSAITQLTIDTTLPPLPIGKIIPTVNIDEMTMTFTLDTQFNPITSSKEIKAQMKVPFGFTLNIERLSEEITLVNDGTNMAKLTIPEGPAKMVNKTSILSSYEDKPLQVFDDAHDSFQSFVKDLTIGDSKVFLMVGNANTLASTPIGEIPIENIPINVTTSLAGLQGFNAKPINITGLDVTSGTTTVLTIPIAATLFNPSLLTITTGDVNFDLVVNKTTLGTVLMNDFKVTPGDNNITAQVLFAPTSEQGVVVGTKFFTNFILNQTQPSEINGSQKSTDIESLKEAMSAISIKTALPGLNRQLLISTYITYQESSLITQKALGGFTIVNPFAASLTVAKINSANITFHGLPVANIDVTEVGFVIPGRSAATSKPISINVNLLPKNLVSIIKRAAADAKIDITPLLPLLNLLDPPSPPPSATTPKRDTNLTTRDETPIQLLVRILKSLQVDIEMGFDIQMDKFPMSLNLTLPKIPVVLDDTVNTLIESMASTVTQVVINNSEIELDTVLISGEQVDGFNLHMKGALTKTGNIKSTINFNTGLNVTFSGKELGVVSMPPLQTDGTNSSAFENDSKFHITNIENFAEFTGALMLSKSINWTLSSNDVQVDAFGLTIKNLSLNTPVSLLGFNGLSDVNVTKFNVSGTEDDIRISLDTDLGNPSNTGIDLGTTVFNVFAGKVLVGPITANGVFLAPKSVNKISFEGPVLIKNLTELFTILAEVESGSINATAQGVSVQPKGSKGVIPWLTGPFQKLILSVPLPKSPDNVPVSNITIEDLEISFTPETAFSPKSSSKKVTSTVNLPIGLDIVSASQSIVILDGRNKVASLEVPNSPVVMNGNTLVSSINGIAMSALDKTAFATFLGSLTASESKVFNLTGSVIASTKKQTLPPIEFNVLTSLKGLQGFQNKPVTVGNLSIAGADPSGISINLEVSLTNPSTLQVGVGDITLDIFYDGQQMGPTILKNLVVAPGTQTYATTFLFSPKTKAAGIAGAELLGNFLTGKDSPLTIKGNANSTTIASLAPTFQSLSLKTTLQGLPIQVLNSIAIVVDKGGKTGLASMNITNALNIGYSMTGITANASVHGQVVGIIDLPNVPTPIPIKAGSQQTVSNIPIKLVADLGSAKSIDVDVGVIVSVNINGFNGPIIFTETGVPTTIDNSNNGGSSNANSSGNTQSTSSATPSTTIPSDATRKVSATSSSSATFK